MALHFKKAYQALISKDTGKSTLNKKKTKLIWPIVIAILLCVGIWSGGMFLTYWYANNYIHVQEGENAPAVFGDSSGAVSALISAFAFAGVIVSMYLQRKDLEMQRESIDIQKDELRRNTKELESQRKEFEIQSKTMGLQLFENTFFNMLSLQQEIVKGLHCTGFLMDELIQITGREVFEYIFEDDCRKEISEKGNSAYQGNKTSLFNHYFLHLYRIVKFVDKTNFLKTKKEKYSYLCILRATLSKYELIHLYYNSIIYQTFKALIEDYSLLNNLDTDALPPNGSDNIFSNKDPYEKSAYDPSINGYNESD